MQTPKKRTTPSKSRRKGKSHLPSLTEANRTVFQSQLDSLPVSAETKRAVMASMNAAANPDAESPDAVIASLDATDQASLRSAMAAYGQTMNRMNARGRGSLLKMTDAEFEAALGQTNEGADDVD